MKLIIHTDGGARGNPGPAAIGAVIEDEKGKLLGEVSLYIGETTNNVAEYQAVIEALKWVKEYRIRNSEHKEIDFYLDSTLVAQQLSRNFKIKIPHLQELAFSVWELEKQLNLQTKYFIVRREKNQHADKLVNKALDEKLLAGS
jgi:ribonuclease HI